MFPQQVKGPVPLQVAGPTAYLPAQSTSSSGTSWTDTLTALMPWVVVIVALALFAPMLKDMFKSNR